MVYGGSYNGRLALGYYQRITPYYTPIWMNYYTFSNLTRKATLSGLSINLDGDCSVGLISYTTSF